MIKLWINSVVLVSFLPYTEMRLEVKNEQTPELKVLWREL